MSRLFNWDLQNLAEQQYMIGKNSDAGADLIRATPAPTAPFNVIDGSQLDTIIELTPAAFSIGAWVNINRIPDPNNDPFGQDSFETFGLVTRSCIVGGDLSPSIGLVLDGSVPTPGIAMWCARQQGAAVSLTNALPITPNKWMFFGGSHAVDTGGPRVYYGELNVPVIEADYGGVSGLRLNGTGNPGVANPGVSAAGRYVDRWGYGPLLLGTRTLQTPPNIDPGSQYGILGDNLTFGSLQGRLAHVTIWNGALTLAQWEKLRTTPPAIRPYLPLQAGFPPLIADWWLNDNGNKFQDRSGHDHDLVSVRTSKSTQPSFEQHGSQGY